MFQVDLPGVVIKGRVEKLEAIILFFSLFSFLVKLFTVFLCCLFCYLNKDEHIEFLAAFPLTHKYVTLNDLEWLSVLRRYVYNSEAWLVF